MDINTDLNYSNKEGINNFIGDNNRNINANNLSYSRIISEQSKIKKINRKNKKNRIALLMNDMLNLASFINNVYKPNNVNITLENTLNCLPPLNNKEEDNMELEGVKNQLNTINLTYKKNVPYNGDNDNDINSTIINNIYNSNQDNNSNISNNYIHNNDNNIITSETIDDMDKINDKINRDNNSLYVKDVECKINLNENLFPNNDTAYISNKSGIYNAKIPSNSQIITRKKFYGNININNSQNKSSPNKKNDRLNRTYNHGGYELYNELYKNTNSNRTNLITEKSHNQQIRKMKKESKYDPLYDDILNKQKDLSKNYIKRYGKTNFGKPKNLTNSERVYLDGDGINENNKGIKKNNNINKNRNNNLYNKTTNYSYNSTYNKNFNTNKYNTNYRNNNMIKENDEDYEVYLDDLDLINKKNKYETLRKLRLLRDQLEKIRSTEKK